MLADGLEQRGADVARAWHYPALDGSKTEWVFPLPPPRFRGVQTTIRSTPRWAAALWRLARGLSRIRPDVVNVHFVRVEALYFLLLRPLFGYRLVLSFHGSDALLPSKGDYPTLRLLLRRANAVTAVSDPVGQAIDGIADDPSVHVKVIPNGIPLAFWGEHHAEHVGAERSGIVTVGRLVAVKGYDVLIQAMRLLRDILPNATLTIVGEGLEREALGAKVMQAGLGNAVRFAGRQSADSVRRHLRQASLFVLPSRSEGLPLALLEAMACGLPAVATQVGGVPEVLSEGTGLIVPPEDPQALADALAELLLHPERTAAMGRAAQQRAQGYALDTMVNGYERLFRVVMGDPPQQPSLLQDPLRPSPQMLRGEDGR